MTQMQPLTRRQVDALAFIQSFIESHGFAPSLEEIGAAMQLSSLATVHKHLENLKAKGYIRRGWNRSRHLQLVAGGACCPTCGRTLEKVLDEAKVSLEIGRKSDIVGSAVDVGASIAPTTTEVP